MFDLWLTVAKLGSEMHPDRVTVIADKLSTLASTQDISEIRHALGPYEDNALWGSLIEEWKQLPNISSKEVASGLRAASAASFLSDKQGSMRIVWTGPSPGLVPVRHTEQVLCELIESAMDRLFFVSFVAYRVESVRGALVQAVERGVKIRILLESSTAHGGKVSYDSVKHMRDSLPAAEMYVWSHEAKETLEFAGGTVHAKCAVADASTAFVTSANLSEHAMERNMECGVLISGGHVPKTLHRHLDALVTTGIVERA